MLPALDELNIITEHQFGFRRGHGTTEQCHRITHAIVNAVENQKYWTGVFLDVKQAFDKVWHEGLLYKIKKWLTAPYFLIISSYLKNRICSRTWGHCWGWSSTRECFRSSAVYNFHSWLTDYKCRSDSNIWWYDDNAIIATSNDPRVASNLIQEELGLIEAWIKKWRIASKRTKISASDILVH